MCTFPPVLVDRGIKCNHIYEHDYRNTCDVEYDVPALWDEYVERSASAVVTVIDAAQSSRFKAQCHRGYVRIDHDAG